MRRWARRVAVFLAFAYPAALVFVFAVLHFIGEHWWVTGVGLYVPRFVFLLPLPFIAAALAVLGERKLLYTQLAALLFVLFPLMGLVVSLPARRGDPSVRVLSFNVDSAFFGIDAVIDAVMKYSPDIVLMQEVFENSAELQKRLALHFPTVQGSTQFIVATKFPITATLEPGKLANDGRQRSPRFLRYTMKTTLGQLAVYNVHPVSPRYGIYAIRGAGLRKELLSGRFFKAENTGEMQADSNLRSSQVKAFATLAGAANDPVIMGGDTNLPTLSPLLSNELSPFVDAFSSVGFGFGFTFPAKHPWMRIDRILASRDLAFSTFGVGCPAASDHLCVFADVKRR